MKSSIRNTTFACALLFASINVQGCVGSALPIAAQVVQWVSNLIPLVDGVRTLVSQVMSGDLPEETKARVAEALERVKDAADRVVAAQGKGIGEESHAAMQALTDAYGHLVATLEKEGIGMGLGPDQTILAATPGKLIIPTFGALKAQAGVE
jgi:hypothetical protein